MPPRTALLPLLLCLAGWGLSTRPALAQDPHGPRITATRWVLPHGRESSIRSAGIRNRHLPRGRPVTGAAAVMDLLEQFPNREAITLSVNEPGSRFEPRRQLLGKDLEVVRDEHRVPLPQQLLHRAERLSSGMTLVVAEYPDAAPGTKVGGFKGWLALRTRFGAGNLYAAVTSGGIPAGTELVTYQQLKDYTANSVFFEAPAFGTLVVHHGHSGGTTNVSANFVPRGEEKPRAFTRNFGWAQPLEMILSLNGEPSVRRGGVVRLSVQAQLPNSFPNPAERPLTIRWALEANATTIVRDSVVVVARAGRGTLAQVARFNVDLPARLVKENKGKMVKLTAVASPGRAPFLNPIDPRRPQRVGLTTFHSSAPTLEDTMTLRLALKEVEGSEKGSYRKGKRLAGPVKLDARNSKPTSTGVVLAKGKPYIVVGTGVCSLWDGQNDGCDSVYRYRTPLEKGGGAKVVWGQLKLVNPNVHLAELIEKQTGKKPVYNPSHVYEAVVIGEGKPLMALVYDGGGYGDNHGALSVSVYEAIPK
jgi:hypothetical protein